MSTVRRTYTHAIGVGAAAVAALGWGQFDDIREQGQHSGAAPSSLPAFPCVPPLRALTFAHCDTECASNAPSAARTEDSSAGYAEWLAARGVCGLNNVALSKECGASLSATGSGLFSSRWRRFGRTPNPATVMMFPLDGGRVLSGTTIAKHPSYAAYADRGYNLVVLYLMIERMKDAHGQADAWMRQIADRQFSAPVMWSFNEIDWLRGTSLYRAVMHQRESLKYQWEQGGVRQACSEVARAADLRSPTFEDYTWATAAFTLFAIPLVDSCAKHNEEADDPHGHGTHSLQIVPGLEIFQSCSANAGAARCHLDVDADARQLCVVCPKVAPGTQLSVAYGDDYDDDASVEQMLFQFGVLDADPSLEVLMIECPIPPVDEWDASIKRRFALLLEDDLRPQLFLSRRQLTGIEKTAAKKVGSAAARQQRFERMFSSGVRETITIFVMDEDQLQARIDGIVKADAEPLAASGMRMAVLTTVVRLLEVKQYELESDEKGTGTLESDQRLLESINAEQRGTTAMPHSGPTMRQRAALRHRMDQKLLVREYLRVYGEALQEELTYLRELSRGRL